MSACATVGICLIIMSATVQCSFPLPIDTDLFYLLTRGSKSRRYIADVINTQYEYEYEHVISFHIVR